MDKPTKINMMCGWRDFGSGWFNVDGGDYPHLHSKDILLEDYPKDYADLIYCSHALEYFHPSYALNVLFPKWREVLKPGGILRIAVPDFRQMAILYTQGKYSLNHFLGPLYGEMGMGDEEIYHKTVYDEESLANVFEQNKFNNIELWDWRKVSHGKFDDHSQAYLPHMDKENGVLISLNMQGIK